MIIPRSKRESGAVSGALISIILMAIAVIALAGLAIWLYVLYNEQKTDVDGRVSVAVTEAVRETQQSEQEKFLDREKEPKRDFVGPDDYGRLTFSYPKTWSAYVDKNGSTGGTYEAYLNPGVVPPVGSSAQPFALRVVIEEKDINQVIAQYDARVKKGDLKTTTTSSNGMNGTRIDGSFDKNRRGAVVIYKVRDKTVSIFTDADTFKPDFDALVQTIGFNE